MTIRRLGSDKLIGHGRVHLEDAPIKAGAEIGRERVGHLRGA
jgi:hypothetical protein